MQRLLLVGLSAVLLAVLVGGPGLAATASAAPAQQGYTVHLVQLGETLYSIAMRYGVSAAAIAAANNIYNPDMIFAGQSLVIPGSYSPPPAQAPVAAPGGYYVVQLGDTLSGIAWRLGTTVSALMAANNIYNPDMIYAGQRLIVPGGGPPPQPIGHVDHPRQQPPAHQPKAPTCGFTYTVCHGDNLSRIAARHGSTVQAIARANGLHYPYTVWAGQRLHIPCAAAKPATDKGLVPAACAREVQIVRPLEGQHVSGVVQIVGSANIKNFQFYKIEYAMGHTPLDNSSFHSIGEVVRTAAWDSVLGTWFVGNMPAGPYTLRLTAVDSTGNFPAPCSVHIHID